MVSNSIDVMAVSETWLNPSIPDSLVDIPGYDIFRRDRDSLGGGVCLYINNQLKCKQRKDLLKSNLEAIWVEVIDGEQTIVVSCIYRPPDSTVEYFDNLLDSLDNVVDSKHLVVMGDLNYNYDMHQPLDNNPVHYIEQVCNMRQLITEATRVTSTSSTLLDVILSNNHDMHVNSGVLKIALSDHYLVYTTIKSCTKSEFKNHFEVKFRDLKNFDREAFVNDLSNEPAFDCEIPHATWENVYSCFDRICNAHAPIRTKRVRNRSNPWVDKELIKLMYARDHAFHMKNRTKDVYWIREYKRLKKFVQLTLSNKKKDYFNDAEISSRTESSTVFWRAFKKLIPTSACKPIPRNLTAQKLNEYFANVAKSIDAKFDDNVDLHWEGPTSIHDFVFTRVTLDQVLNEFRRLDSTSNLDVLNCDRFLLKLASPIIAPVLVCIINDSLFNSHVPDDWKKARVTPIFKGGEDADILNPSDYRPLSIICHVAKIVEKLVKEQLLTYLTEHNFISSDQSAYLRGHSTVTCLHRLMENWLENINEGEFTGICMVDITKCFDSINHELLLKKLECYGIRGRENRWFQSYLENRTQAVYCNNVLSDFLVNPFGVPQGSILGPLLFLIFINDIVNCTTRNNMLNLFADDLLSSVSGNSPAEVKLMLETNVVKLECWYRKNRLALHPTKTKFMYIGSKEQLSLIFKPCTFNYCNNSLPMPDHAKYLGLLLEPDLSWNMHIDKLVKKLNYLSSILKNMSNYCTSTLLLTYFRSFVQPVLDYGISIWGNCSSANINKVQRVLNRMGRIIIGNFDYMTTRGADLLKQLRIPSVEERRDYFTCKLVYQSVHGLNPTYLNDFVLLNSDLHDYHTRSDRVFLPSVRHNMYSNSLAFKGGQLFNQLPDFVRNSCDVDDFKANYRIYLFGPA